MTYHCADIQCPIIARTSMSYHPMRRFLILEETRRKKPKRTRKTDAGITPKELCRASELSLTEDAPYGDDDDWEDPLDAPYEDDSDWEEDEEPQSGWPLPVAARQVMA